MLTESFKVLDVLSFICRLFLVQASRTGRQEEVRSFFERMADSLHDRKEWKDWFGWYSISAL